MENNFVNVGIIGEGCKGNHFPLSMWDPCDPAWKAVIDTALRGINAKGGNNCRVISNLLPGAPLAIAMAADECGIEIVPIATFAQEKFWKDKTREVHDALTAKFKTRRIGNEYSVLNDKRRDAEVIKNSDIILAVWNGSEDVGKRIKYAADIGKEVYVFNLQGKFFDWKKALADMPTHAPAKKEVPKKAFAPAPRDLMEALAKSFGVSTAKLQVALAMVKSQGTDSEIVLEPKKEITVKTTAPTSTPVPEPIPPTNIAGELSDEEADAALWGDDVPTAAFTEEGIEDPVMPTDEDLDAFGFGRAS